MRIFKIIRGILNELSSIRGLLNSILEEAESLSKDYKGLVGDIKALKQTAAEIELSTTSSGNSLSRFLREQKTVKEIEEVRLEEIREEFDQAPTKHDLMF